MVKVRQYHPQDDADQVDIHAWVAEFIQRHAIAENEAAAFIHACAFASDALTQEFDPDTLWSPAAGCLQTGLEMVKFSPSSLLIRRLSSQPYCTVLFAKAAYLWTKYAASSVVRLPV